MLECLSFGPQQSNIFPGGPCPVGQAQTACFAPWGTCAGPLAGLPSYSRPHAASPAALPVTQAAPHWCGTPNLQGHTLLVVVAVVVGPEASLPPPCLSKPLPLQVGPLSEKGRDIGALRQFARARVLQAGPGGFIASAFFNPDVTKSPMSPPTQGPFERLAQFTWSLWPLCEQHSDLQVCGIRIGRVVS